MRFALAVSDQGLLTDRLHHKDSSCAGDKRGFSITKNLCAQVENKKCVKVHSMTQVPMTLTIGQSNWSRSDYPENG